MPTRAPPARRAPRRRACSPAPSPPPRSRDVSSRTSASRCTRSWSSLPDSRRDRSSRSATIRESRTASRSSCSANRGTASGSSRPHVQERLRRRLDRGGGRLQLVRRVGDEVAADRVQAPRLRDVGDHERAPSRRSPVGRRRGAQPSAWARRSRSRATSTSLGLAGPADRLAEAGRERSDQRRRAWPRDAARARAFANTVRHPPSNRRTPSCIEPRIWSRTCRSSGRRPALRARGPRRARRRSPSHPPHVAGGASRRAGPGRRTQPDHHRPERSPRTSIRSLGHGSAVICRSSRLPRGVHLARCRTRLRAIRRRPARSPDVHLGQPGVHHVLPSIPSSPTPAGPTRRDADAQREEAWRASWQGCSSCCAGRRGVRRRRRTATAGAAAATGHGGVTCPGRSRSRARRRCCRSRTSWPSCSPRQNPDVQVSVDGPGTGDGFVLFCNGETDISDASRPIEDDEKHGLRRRRGSTTSSSRSRSTASRS